MNRIKETIDYLTNHKKTGYNTCVTRRNWLALGLQDTQEEHEKICKKLKRKTAQNRALNKKIKEVKSIINVNEGMELPGWNDYSSLLDEIREIINV